MGYIYKGILLSLQKNKILPFVATWMELEIIILSEICHTEKNTMSLNIETKKIIQLNLYTKQIDRYKQ